MKISDVLWEAANRFLVFDERDISVLCKWNFEDSAIMEASNNDPSLRLDTGRFCNSIGYHYFGFENFNSGPERQAARYNWLMFAYLIAVEEGL